MKFHFLPQRLEVKLWLGDRISILGQAVYAIYSGTYSLSYLRDVVNSFLGRKVVGLDDFGQTWPPAATMTS
jgi:hypothetical protein